MGNREDRRRPGVIRTVQIPNLAESKKIAIYLDAVPRFHTDVPLLAVILAKGDADNRYRHAQMPQHHAPMAAAELAQTAPEPLAMRSALMQLHQRQDNHPERH